MYYNSYDLTYKNPFGAVKTNTEVYFFVEVTDATEVYLVIKSDDGDYKYIWMNRIQKNDKIGYEITFIPDRAILYFYHFQINVKSKHNLLKNSYEQDFQLTVYDDYKVPDWYKNGIVYQIFPDRFYNPYKHPIDYKPNSFIYATWDDLPMNIINEERELVRHDFYGGNLQGVIEKLDYLELLGVNIIYFNPIFQSTSNHKYNTQDYHKIDTMLGDEPTFKRLLDECKKRNMHVILDGVFNHTGDDSEYFKIAQNDKNSMYYSWYYFKDYPKTYESWWGFTTLPKVNSMNPTFRDFVMGKENSILSHWMKLGVDGWRLDVVDELDGEFVEEFKSSMKYFNKDSVLIGEVWEDASNKIAYSQRKKYFMGKQLDSVMGYPFRTNVIDFLNCSISGKQITDNFKLLKENYPREAFYANMNLLSTHDVPRLINMLNFDMDNFKSALALQMTFAGVPHIYYADEVGQQGAMTPDSRRAFPWNNINQDILKLYKKLISLRKNNRIFVDGEIKFKYLNDDVFFFTRYFDDENNIDKKVSVLIVRKTTILTIDLKYGTIFDVMNDCQLKVGEGTINHTFKKGFYIFSNYDLNK